MKRLFTFCFALLATLTAWAGDEVALPAGVRPAGLAAGRDGSLYVASAAQGHLFRVAPGAGKSELFVTASALGANGSLGVGVDDRAQLLWVCTLTGTLEKPLASALKAVELPEGRVRGSYDLPAGSVCNDLTIGRDGTVYLTDSAQSMLLRLRKGEDRISVWLKDDRFTTDGSGVGMITDGRGANGITVDGMGAIMVMVSGPGRLFRVPVRWDGSAGVPVEVKLSRTLIQADGLRLWTKRRLLVVEADGGLARIDWVGETGKVQTMAESLGRPTAVIVRGGKAIVAHVRTTASDGANPSTTVEQAGISMVELPKM
ncbi:sugar lactone lactonase YvrE [Chitinivorax tropicus]|uniref:Sugar lactone lactonase YvrE n=1 Tax=Chitinivorax tropicus TaxID=714531 RepID=A0A840MKM9_9PROT|nr:hypothetical protein [Chitinivorax tropicus]MBB5019734.1 sugar lactone lactonase YvrE [Chitinivorax tropicus]